MCLVDDQSLSAADLTRSRPVQIATAMLLLGGAGWGGFSFGSSKPTVEQAEAIIASSPRLAVMAATVERLEKAQERMEKKLDRLIEKKRDKDE